MSVTIYGSGSLVVGATQAVTQTSQNLATATWTDLANLSVTVTPKSASSRFLIMYSINANMGVSGRGFGIQILRNATVVSGPLQSYEVYSGSGGDMRVKPSFQYIDSPATTSAITYKLQASAYNNGAIGFQESAFYSSITVLELAA